MSEETPFMAFWKAINTHLHEQHRLPEIRYGAARGIWEDALSAAKVECMQPHYDRIIDSTLDAYAAFE